MKKRFVLVCVFLLVAVLAADAAVIKVKVSIANVRSKPDAASAVVSRVTQGAMFEVVRTVGAWYEIAVDDANGNLVPGYISADLVETIGGGGEPAQPAGGIRAGQMGAQGGGERQAPAAARPAPAGGMTFEFSLGGGLGMIAGGDINDWIRGSTAYFADLNKYYSTATDYKDTFTTDWPEWKSMMNFKGEFILRINPSFGVGLGVEFLTKSFTGTAQEKFRQTNTQYNFASYYEIRNRTEDFTDNYEYPVSVIPITLSGYGFFPMGPKLEIFVTGGVGYYLGKLKSNYSYRETYDQLYDRYQYGSSVKYDTMKNKGQYDLTETLDLTCNTIGFHFGGGFGYSLTPNIKVFAEALYRIANFKEWTGSYAESWTDKYNYGLLSQGYKDYTDTGEEKYNGTLYTYTYHDAMLNKDYTQIGLYDEDPVDSTTGKDFTKTAVDLSGIALRLGIRIGFGRR